MSETLNNAGTKSVIIVGAGSAGSVLARRLLDAGLRVQVIEAGDSDMNPDIADLSRMGHLWGSAQDWDYRSEPQVHAHDLRMVIPRGKVLGGSHALNASIWVRCPAADFDAWEASGARGWGWSTVEPLYRRIENWRGVTSEDRGTEGLQDVSGDYVHSPIQADIVRAATQWGLPLNPDYNVGDTDGVSWEQLTIRDHRRLTSYRAYLYPERENPRLNITTGAWVHRLLFEAGDVIGVEYETESGLHRALADEVVLCAGALDSPRILLHSGIGPAAELSALGIGVTLDLPGVGKNLQDHLLVPVIFTAEREIEAPAAGIPLTQSHWFWRSRPELSSPDTQPICFSIPMLQEGMSAPENSFTLMAGLITPRSRGSIRLASADPRVRARIDPNILADEEDVRSLVASVRQCREVGAEPALAQDWGARELYPGSHVGDAELEEYVRSHVTTYHHHVGTCRMGEDELAVVDSTLRLRGGIGGVRVADASVMPTIPGGNTNAPSVMIGERAADLIIASLGA